MSRNKVCFLCGLATAVAAWPSGLHGAQDPDSLTAADRIEPALAAYLDTASASVPIPVILIMASQMSDADRRVLFESRGANQTDREVMMNGLREFADSTQEELSQVLDSLQGVRSASDEPIVRRVRRLWINNRVALEATPAVIRVLANRPDLRSIHLDLRRRVNAAPTWNVSRVGAPQVWPPSLTNVDGTGVVIGVLDSGIDFSHPDLANRELAGTHWDFFDDDNDQTPAAGDKHGTQVAGVVAGDGANGTQTGVAPGATLISVRVSENDSASEGGTMAAVWHALEQGADIVNVSLGWIYHPFDDLHDPPDFAGWRDLVANSMNAGLLFVTVSGNDNNPYTEMSGQNVRTPGMVPLAVTAGATQRPSLSNPNKDVMWLWSNRGPVSWQAIAGSSPSDGWSKDYPMHPGLQKPDVVAPGREIKTTTLTSEAVFAPLFYEADLSGTSMAAPHVAGVAALLKEKDPTLTPFEIKFILEETAQNTFGGLLRPDDDYGWGRVDAAAALTYLADGGIDATPYDLSITGTNAHWTTTDIWVDNSQPPDGIEENPTVVGPNTLYAEVRNLGGQVVSNVEVQFFYADIGTMGIGGFDHDNDGNPRGDSDFNYIGSYWVPTLGPAGSAHAIDTAAVRWTVPNPTGDHWCVGVAIVAHLPPNDPELDTSNNIAFRNFFDIDTGPTNIAFNMVPPPSEAPSPAFAFEIDTENLPAGTRIVLTIDSVLNTADVEPIGMTPVEVVTGPNSPFRRAIVRFRMDSTDAILHNIVSPGNETTKARLDIHVPRGEQVEGEMLIILNVRNEENEPVGGLTLRVNDRPGRLRRTR